MLSFLFFSVKRAWQGFWRNAVMSLAATATMVLMLLLLAGFWIIQTGLLAGLQFTEQKVEVVAYLQPNATDGADRRARGRDPSDARGRRRSTSSPATRRSTASASSMKAQGREDLTQHLDSNPLYASLEVKLKDPTALRAVGDVLAPESTDRPQRHQHRGPRRPAADRHEHPADRRHRAS